MKRITIEIQVEQLVLHNISLDAPDDASDDEIGQLVDLRVQDFERQEIMRGEAADVIGANVIGWCCDVTQQDGGCQ